MYIDNNCKRNGTSKCITVMFHYQCYIKFVANIYTCTSPHPLYHARTPATSDSASGRYVDDIILAGVVIKHPKIWMTELCRLG